MRGFAGDVGSPLAHRHTDVGLAERWRVVDAVARHGHDLTAAPQRLHQEVLLLRPSASEHVGGGHQPIEFGVVRMVQVVAGGDEIRAAVLVREVEPFGDRHARWPGGRR